MKKLINTRKVIVAAMILTIVLFVFPLSSFSGPGGPKGGVDPIVCSSEGYITDIEFDFGDGFDFTFKKKDFAFRRPVHSDGSLNLRTINCSLV